MNHLQVYSIWQHHDQVVGVPHYHQYQYAPGSKFDAYTTMHISVHKYCFRKILSSILFYGLHYPPVGWPRVAAHTACRRCGRCVQTLQALRAGVACRCCVQTLRAGGCGCMRFGMRALRAVRACRWLREDCVSTFRSVGWARLPVRSGTRAAASG